MDVKRHRNPIAVELELVLRGHGANIKKGVSFFLGQVISRLWEFLFDVLLFLVWIYIL